MNFFNIKVDNQITEIIIYNKANYYYILCLIQDITL